MSVANYALVSAALKKTIVASVVMVSAVAIPVTAMAAIPEKKNNFINPIKQHTETLYKTVGKRVKGGGENVWGSYSNTYSEAAEKINQNIKNVGQELKKGENVLSSIAPYLTKEHIDGYNYHAFTNREVINAAIKYLPTMIRDSIKDGFTDGENYELLSFRKMYYIISHPDFKKLVAALSKLGIKKDQILGKTTKEDAQGIMEIIKSLPFEEGTGLRDDKSSPRITRFIREVTKHIEEINGDDARSYPSAKDLVIDILTGKNYKNETKSNLEEVIKQLQEKTDALIAKVPVENEKLKGAQKVLKALKKVLEAAKEKV